MQTESFAIQPFQQIIPAYLYEQYSDDSDLLAFVNAYNQLAQGYLDWFNETALGLYTSANISGPLLDWTAYGIYGIERPVISTLSTKTTGGMNVQAMNIRAMNDFQQIRSGNAQVASDDLYKRVLTWILYKNDGIQASVTWLRKRVARFLYGANGSDVSLDYLQDVSITRPNIAAKGALSTVPMNTQAMNARLKRTVLSKRTLLISIPSSSIAQQFASLLGQGYLPLPFQVTYQIQLT